MGKSTKMARDSVCLCLSPEKGLIPMHGPEVPLRRHSSTSNIIYLPKITLTLCKTDTVKPTKQDTVLKRSHDHGTPRGNGQYDTHSTGV